MTKNERSALWDKEHPERRKARGKKWRAEFFPKPNQRVYLGEFNTKEEALRVRNEAVKGIQHTV